MSSPRNRRWLAGFTLVELMIVMAIMATIASLGLVGYRRSVKTARDMVTIQEMKHIQDLITFYEAANGELPLTLDDVDGAPFIDPWGNPYEYLNFATLDGGKGKGKSNGKKRKDRFIVPLNSTYDLYSKGPDGESVGPLTAAASRDDLIRANDGDYIGPAADY